MASILSTLNIRTVLIGVVVILIVYKLLQRIKYKQPPGPFALPLIGNYEVLLAKFWFEKFDELAKKYGPVFTIYFGPVKTVILNDIKSVTEALVKKQTDFAGRPFIASGTLLQSMPQSMLNRFARETIFSILVEDKCSLPTGGTKIIIHQYGKTSATTETTKQNTELRHGRHVFHTKPGVGSGVSEAQYLMGDHLEKVVHDSMTKCLRKMAEESGPFDPEPYIDLMAFNILHTVCFGGSCDLDDPEFKRFMKLDKDIVAMFGNGFVEDIFPFLIKTWPTKKYRTIMGMLEEIYTMYRKKFKEHKESFDSESIRDFTDSLILARKEAEDEENEDVLSLLTDRHMVQTIADIFFAGVDTSRIVLYFAVRYMAGLSDIQSKVQEELDRVVGKNRLPGIKDRENLGYSEATLHEVMRLGTPAPVGLPHATICDTTVGGYDIPKGTMVIINLWALHRDPNYWKDAEKFDPTRFLDADGKVARRPESWLPFSAGKRVCMGEAVAKSELHLAFCSILQRFQISLPEGTSPEMTYKGKAGLVEPAPFKIVVAERK